MLKNSRKLVSMSIAAVLSGVVFITTALAASSNVSGYEKVKDSLFSLYSIQNYTVEMDYGMEEDGIEFLQGSLSAKAQNKNNSSFNISFSFDGKTYSVENSMTDGIIITKPADSDVYHKFAKYSTNSDGISLQVTDNQTPFQLTDNQKKLINVVLDMFAGDTKNYFTNDNGKITMKLERNQVPELFQAALSVMSEQMNKAIDSSMYAHHSEDDIFNDNFFENKLLNLINDLAIESVYAEGYIDDNNLLNDAKLTFTLTGKDADGTPHALTTSLKYVISDVGTTTAEAIDLTGKEVSEFDLNNISYEGLDINIEDKDAIINAVKGEFGSVEIEVPAE